MSQALRQQITNELIDSIQENDLLPWRKPWRSHPNSGRPMNAKTRSAYQGINPVLLDLHAQKFGFSSRYWATYKQWESLGCKVQRRPADVPRGQWGRSLVYFKPIQKRVVNRETSEEEIDEFLLMKTFAVFNAEQVAGSQAWRLEEDDSHEVPSFEPADQLIESTGARIDHRGDRAFYRRPAPEGSWPHHTDGDFIVLPPKHSFDPTESYYETAFHELAHWSECRLGWDHNDHGYAMGELVAEISACYVASELAIPVGEGLGNHASYLKSWLDGMKGDVSFIFKASTQASKVADFLLSFQKAEVAEGVTS